MSPGQMSKLQRPFGTGPVARLIPALKRRAIVVRSLRDEWKVAPSQARLTADKDRIRSDLTIKDLLQNQQPTWGPLRITEDDNLADGLRKRDRG